MASVWAARFDGPHDFTKAIAIKTMLPDLAAESEYRTMFLDEARVASKLHHPNLCELLELGEDCGTLFMAMEWVDGVSLQQLLRPDDHLSPLSPTVAARIVADACEGLHAAHESVDADGAPLAIVHRDVSPQNVLVSTDGRVKVVDFGIATARGKRHMTAAGQAKGKLSYMAPEQLGWGRVDRRADVFALGCVLFELTTGRRPFEGASSAEIIKKILNERPQPPSAIAGDVPVELERIIMRALEKSPDDRFASAEGMRLALHRWLRGRGTPLEVAATIQDRMGAMLGARRAALCTAPESEETSPASSPTLSKSSRPNTPRLVTALGALVILLGLSSMLWSRDRFVETIPSPPTAAVQPSDLAIGIASSPRTVAVENPSEPTAANTSVALRMTPASAYLVVDGERTEGADGLVDVARPPKGEFRVILVKAEGYLDHLMVVDSTTPSELDVRLSKAELSAASPTAD